MPGTEVLITIHHAQYWKGLWSRVYGQCCTSGFHVKPGLRATLFAWTETSVTAFMAKNNFDKSERADEICTNFVKADATFDSVDASSVNVVKLPGLAYFGARPTVVSVLWVRALHDTCKRDMKI